MSRTTKWLKCNASLGQFQDELAVSGTDFEGEIFSLFVAREFVDCYGGNPVGGSVEALLEAIPLQEKSGLVLVQLPGRTFGNGSTITVRTEELLESKECVPA